MQVFFSFLKIPNYKIENLMNVLNLNGKYKSSKNSQFNWWILPSHALISMPMYWTVCNEHWFQANSVQIDKKLTKNVQINTFNLINSVPIDKALL